MLDNVGNVADYDEQLPGPDSLERVNIEEVLKKLGGNIGELLRASGVRGGLD